MSEHAHEPADPSAPSSPPAGLMSQVRVVLVRPQVAGNIGAVARCMENFAAGPLYLVNPEADPFCREALRRSTHGQHRLHEAQVVSALEDGLAGCVYAVGTSRWTGPVHQRENLTPRDLGRTLSPVLAQGEVALLFGTEDNGLSREELLTCDAIVQIPGNPAYPTLNLSHAVAVCLYEAFVTLATQRHTDDTTRPVSEPADLAMMTRLMDKLQHALLTLGYLRPEKPDHLMFPIRAILSRAQLTRTEAQILIGLAQQIEEFTHYGRSNDPPGNS